MNLRQWMQTLALISSILLKGKTESCWVTAEKTQVVYPKQGFLFFFFFPSTSGLLVSSKPRTIRQWKALYRRRSSLETGRLDASLANTALIPGVSLSSRHSQFQAWTWVCLWVWLQVLVCLRVSLTCSNFYFSLSSETLIMFPLCKAVPVFPFSVHSLRGMTTCKCVCVCVCVLSF